VFGSLSNQEEMNNFEALTKVQNAYQTARQTEHDAYYAAFTEAHEEVKRAYTTARSMNLTPEVQQWFKKKFLLAAKLDTEIATCNVEGDVSLRLETLNYRYYYTFRMMRDRNTWKLNRIGENTEFRPVDWNVDIYGTWVIEQTQIDSLPTILDLVQSSKYFKAVSFKDYSERVYKEQKKISKK
jgi:hypothetical protein